jgi:hypothetical protein
MPGAIIQNLLVDTGAQKTSIEDKIAQALGLIPIRFDPVVGVSGKPELYPIYRMAVGIGMGEDGTGAALQKIFFAEVAGTPSPPIPWQHVGLLGRDFLQFLRLVYDGPQGTFELIDYQHVSVPQRPMPKETAAFCWVEANRVGPEEGPEAQAALD